MYGNVVDSRIINRLLTEIDEKISYYTKHYKKTSLCERLPFIGILDLGHLVLCDMLGAWCRVPYSRMVF